jgi:hypothetical protein
VNLESGGRELEAPDPNEKLEGNLSIFWKKRKNPIS